MFFFWKPNNKPMSFHCWFPSFNFNKICAATCTSSSDFLLTFSNTSITSVFTLSSPCSFMISSILFFDSGENKAAQKQVSLHPSSFDEDVWHFEACNSFFSVFEEDDPACFSIPLALALAFHYCTRCFLYSSVVVVSLNTFLMNMTEKWSLIFLYIAVSWGGKNSAKQQSSLHPLLSTLHAAHAIISDSEAQKDK